MPVTDEEVRKVCQEIEGEIRRATQGKRSVRAIGIRKEDGDVAYRVHPDGDAALMFTFDHEFYLKEKRAKTFFKRIKEETIDAKKPDGLIFTPTRGGNIILPEPETEVAD